MRENYLTESEFGRLSALAGALRGSTHPERAADLEARLREVSRRDGGEDEDTQVGMGALATVRELDRGVAFTYRLVFPAEADIDRGRISVLSPLGAALLGRSEGEEFSYESPGGIVRVRVERVIHER